MQQFFRKRSKSSQSCLKSSKFCVKSSKSCGVKEEGFKKGLVKNPQSRTLNFSAKSVNKGSAQKFNHTQSTLQRTQNKTELQQSNTYGVHTQKKHTHKTANPMKIVFYWIVAQKIRRNLINQNRTKKNILQCLIKTKK